MRENEAHVLNEFFYLSPYAALRVKDGSITECNAAAGRLFGESWPGRPFEAFLGSRHTESLNEAIKNNRACYLPDWNGQGFNAGVLMLPFREFNILIIYQSLSDEHDAEIANVMLNVDQHLRVQLTNLQFSHAALARELGDAASEKAAHNLSVIQQMVLRLTRLSGNLRDVARFLLKAEELDAENIDLAGLCRRVTDRCGEYAARRRVSINFNCEYNELIVQGDEARLERLLLNLISNALVYGADGGCADVSLSVSGETVVLAVSDNGRGMDASEVASIFKAYRSVADMSSAGRHGLGLGLPLVQHIARLHGGTALVEARAGGGVKVAVSIPYVKSEHEHILRDSMVDYSGGFDLSKVEMSVLPLV